MWMLGSVGLGVMALTFVKCGQIGEARVHMWMLGSP
jgi:hypothetical protein